MALVLMALINLNVDAWLDLQVSFQFTVFYLRQKLGDMIFGKKIKNHTQDVKKSACMVHKLSLHGH